MNCDNIKNLRELREKNKKEQEEIIFKFEEHGVKFISLDGVIIDPNVKISKGVVIYPGTIIKGESEIGENTVLGPNTVIENAVIGANCVINSSQIYSSAVENKVTIGPFSHVRPNCVIKNNVHIGNFVEVKNSVIDENTKAGHLTYIGDSDVGKGVNFGCGSITVNYDGTKKARCNIGDGAFIGSNVNLVAPPDGIKIGENAYIACGSTITKNIPAGALAISRTRELKTIEGWTEKHKNIKK